MGPLTKVALTLLLGSEAARVQRRNRNLANTTSSSGSWKAVKAAGKIELVRPAFLFYDDAKDEILVSSFGKTNKPSDPVQWPLPAYSSILKLPASEIESAFKTRSFAGKYGKEIQMVKEDLLQWPNKLSRVPAEYGDYVVVPDGFLVPLKSDGNIFFMDPKGNLARITNNKPNTFYHEVEWHDFNGDGLKDILTVRVNKNGFVPGDYDEGDMLWLENPGAANFTGEWKEHLISKGPDVIFKTVPHEGGLAVFCTEFFRTKEPHNDPRISVRLLNMKGEQTAVRIIDTNLGLPFAVSLDDLDGDGKKELIATNHQDDETEIKAAIFAYEVPWDNLIEGEYPRHTLAWHPSLIKQPGKGVGSPGFAYSFYPQKDMTGPKHIVCAGDGSFDVWYLQPTGRFTYDIQILDFPGTTGELLLRDFDGDGIMDILLPDNDEWALYGITFQKTDDALPIAAVEETANSVQCSSADHARMRQMGGGSRTGSVAERMAACGRSTLSWTFQWQPAQFIACASQNGISKSCAGCFEKSGQYGYSNCKTACLAGWCTAGCLRCVAPYDPQLERCTGALNIEKPSPC